MPKPKKFRNLHEVERRYFPDAWAERQRQEEEKRIGLGGVIARKMLEAKP